MKQLLRGALRIILRPVLGPGVPVAVQRAWLEWLTALLRGGGRGVAAAGRLGGRPVEWSAPRDGAATTTILFLHGGGYVIGSPRAYRGLARPLAERCRAGVAALDYRLAPEHPHPAARHDALAAYRELMERGLEPGDIVIAGDSAGGGLALATAVAIRDAGLPPPRALVLISPWLDLTLSGETVSDMAATDPLLSAATLARWGGLYTAGRDPADPGCSPLFADVEGLPPTLVQVGSDEILFADSQRLAARLGPGGVLEVYPGLWHDFQLLGKVLPEADEALDSVAAFLARA